jgi:hypothetical protein
MHLKHKRKGLCPHTSTNAQCDTHFTERHCEERGNP